MAASPDSHPLGGWWGRFAVHSARCAVWERGIGVSYGELLETIDSVSREFTREGVGPGDVIGLEAGCGTQGFARLLAALRAGAIVALVRPGALADSAALRFTAWTLPEGKAIAPRGESDSHPLIERLRARGRPGLLFHSGGTTGLPKLVLHDAAELMAASAVDRVRDYRLIVVMPLAHIGGFDATFRALGAGATVVVAERIEPLAVANAARQAGADVLVTTPSFLNLMRSALPDAMAVLRRFRVIAYGAEPMSPAQLAQLTRACPRTEFRLRFGTTETGAVALHAGADGSFALAPTVEFRVVDGELWLRQRGTMLGYLNQPTRGLTEDGWFATGDMVEEGSSGALRLIGRRESTINVGGNKVQPEEVERTLDEVPGIEALRAKAEPHAIMGQVVALDVVRDSKVGASDLRQQIRDRAAIKLPPFARPVSIRFVGALTLTDAGKLARREGG